jgi:hypothetical protein
MDYSFDNQEEKHPQPEQKEERQTQHVATRDPMDANQLLTSFAHFEPVLDDMQAKAESHQVVDDASSQMCAEMAAQSRKVANAIEAKRKDKAAPYNAVLGALNSFTKKFKDRLAMIQRTLEDKNRPYLIDKERKRREAEAKARADAEKIRQEQERKRREAEEAAAKKGEEPPPPDPAPMPVAAVPPAETKIKTDFGSQRIETEWTWTIGDIRKLPDACLKERSAQVEAAVRPWINAQVKAGVREIPGVNIFEQEVLKTRAK